MRMDLVSLVADCGVLEIVGNASPSIRTLAFRAQDATPESLFFCLRGVKSDGHDYVAQAVARGAVAVVCERPVAVAVPQVIVSSARRAMALVAARFFHEPSTRLLVAGITGTNGKTTTAHLLARCFDAAGLPCGLLGTIRNKIGGVEYPVALTTAESVDLQRMFDEMVEAGDRACAMEVSSHALDLERTAGTKFAAVVFTNLTRDHLDYHHDLEEYYLTKQRLFLPDDQRQSGAVAVVNVDDPWGRRLAAACASAYGDDLWTYAIEQEAAARARDLRLEPHGSSFTVEIPRAGQTVRLRTRLGGRFNVENALAAATTLVALGLPATAASEGIAQTGGVDGRFEAVDAGQPFTVLVDYAHTPDSLENVLRAARGICSGRLHVVFGCGGDRDRGKRPLMGAIASSLAESVVVTSDNPRSEDPQVIIAEILEGIGAEARSRVEVEPDRRRAIALALRDARAGDVVVIAGKGHEKGQIVGDTRVPFDDRDVAREVLQEIRSPRAGA